MYFFDYDVRKLDVRAYLISHHSHSVKRDFSFKDGELNGAGLVLPMTWEDIKSVCPIVKKC